MTLAPKARPSARKAAPPHLPLDLPHQHTLTESQLDRLIREHRGTMDDVLMTPALAEYILQHYNGGNRRMRAHHADNFVKALQKGRWMNTGESVIFAAGGPLNSGQHRLAGIARSGVSAVMDLRFGIPRAAFPLTDTGAKRLAADVLSIEGSVSSFSCAAAIKLLLAYEVGLPGAYHATMRTGNDEILAGYRRWPGIEHATNVTQRHMNRKGFNNASVNAFTFLALLDHPEEEVTAFLDIVESGLAKSKDDAPRLLRERILSDGSTRGDRATVIERLALFIKAWQAWKAGERMKRLAWRTDEAFPQMTGKLP